MSTPRKGRKQPKEAGRSPKEQRDPKAARELEARPASGGLTLERWNDLGALLEALVLRSPTRKQLDSAPKITVKSADGYVELLRFFVFICSTVMKGESAAEEEIRLELGRALHFLAMRLESPRRRGRPKVRRNPIRDIEIAAALDEARGRGVLAELGRVALAMNEATSNRRYEVDADRVARRFGISRRELEGARKRVRQRDARLAEPLAPDPGEVEAE